MSSEPSTTNGTAEGARYALLRRLSPAMRHHLVVNLQPIGMIYDVMQRRLQSPAPDLVQIQESAAKINGFSRAAVRSCLDVMTWLSPEEGAASTVAEGVGECLGLLNGNFNFRGFSITNEVGQMELTVPRTAIRHVLTVSMLACTDACTEPADLTLRAEAGPDQVVLIITLEDAVGGEGFPNEGAYRILTWDDVSAIAAEEGVAVSHSAKRVSLTFPVIIPAVPLTVD